MFLFTVSLEVCALSLCKCRLSQRVLKFPSTCKTCRLGELETDLPIGVNVIICLCVTDWRAVQCVSRCVLGYAVAPAKQMKETSSTCFHNNKSPEVLQVTIIQDTHAVENRAQDAYV